MIIPFYDKKPILLSREKFRESVFERDSGKCVFCNSDGVDAHHIMERRLFPDGGYYIENGITVCEICHLRCESTEISVEEARAAAAIKIVVLPPHLYRDQRYDKWGNPILETGFRLPGELADDESVRKILHETVIFDQRLKYPRTYHLPWSNPTKDDRFIEDVSFFEGKEVVVTEKMDGENTTLYPFGLHARSVDSGNHPSRTWVKKFWANISGDIPEGMRICGENVFAKHSIQYESLDSYFLGFSIWEGLRCLSWDETQEWFQLLEIKSVPVLFEGIYDPDFHKSWKENDQKEGYVLRVKDEFRMKDFKKCVAKYVRKNHVQSSSHWSHERIVENKMKEGE